MRVCSVYSGGDSPSGPPRRRSQRTERPKVSVWAFGYTRYLTELPAGALFKGAPSANGAPPITPESPYAEGQDLRGPFGSCVRAGSANVLGALWAVFPPGLAPKPGLTAG